MRIYTLFKTIANRLNSLSSSITSANNSISSINSRVTTLNNTITTVNNSVPKIACGKISTSVPSASYKDYTITFPKAFSSTPWAIVCFESTSSSSSIGSMSVGVYSTTTTRLVVRVFNNTTSTRAPNIRWAAFDPNWGG